MDQKTYFISYTTRTKADISWAVWVEWVLRELLGQKTLMQEYDSPVGGNFKIFMDESLKKADYVVCILTHDYMQSTNCAEEWTNAKQEQLVPVKFDNCDFKGLLRSRVYINLYQLEREEAKKMLLAELEKLNNPPQRPTAEPDFPAAHHGPARAQAELTEPDFPVFARHNLPDRNPYFTGRVETLAQITLAFRNTSKLTLAGAGGFGKSQLAFEYAYRRGLEYQYIWLVNAETQWSLENDYRQFALRTGLPAAKTEDFALVLQHVLLWFERNDRFLFIYDNAEGLAASLADFLPQGYLRGHILINTRDNQAIIGELIDVGVFAPPEAVAFLQKRLPGAVAGEAQNLAQVLGYLPLALEHAAAYMVQTKRTCAQYMQLLPQGMMKILGKPVANTNYQATIATTWQISIDQIKSAGAVQLFNLCAYCASDNIPLALFIEGRGELPPPLRDMLKPGNEPDHDEIVSELTRYSLLALTGRDADGNALLSMHRLIQMVVRHNLAEDTQWLSCCLNMAYRAFNYEWGNKKSMDAFVLRVSHILAIADHAEVMLAGDEEAQEKTAWLYNEAGRGFEFNNGQYEEALHWYKKALAIYESVLGLEHPDTAATYNNIASVYDHQGEYARALEWYKKALAIDESVLGLKHPDTADTFNNIAVIYRRQGEYAQALKWYEKALAIDESVLGLEHPSTAITYNNIAVVYNHQGAYAQALEWYEKALAIRESVLGLEHPSTATTYNNIAVVYNNQGEYAQALEWYIKSYGILHRKLGPTHPTTKLVQNNMETAYQHAGFQAPFAQWLRKQLGCSEP